MRYTLFTLLITGIAFLQPANAQESVVESNDYKISYEVQDCHDLTNGLHRAYALVTFENKTNEEITLHFDMKNISMAYVEHATTKTMAYIIL